MRILFLSALFPYPPDNGTRIRAYNLLKQLSCHHELDLVAFGHYGKTPHGADLRDLCRSVHVVPYTVYDPRRLQALLGYFSPTPRSLVDTHSYEMADVVRQHLMQNQRDVVIACTLGTARYVPKAACAPAVLDEFQAAAHMYGAYLSGGGLRHLRAKLTCAKLRRYVARLVRRFDACTVASDVEGDILRGMARGYDSVSVIPNGVDVDHYRRGLARPMPGTLVYTGALTYSANYDAVQYFLTDILPGIRTAVQDARFAVTGATRSVALDRLPVSQGVTYTGYLDDVRPTIAGSWALVVPLRMGGGTRLKILEAMALGTPVISTSKGAEGLDVTPEQDILIADGPALFAAQTVRLLQNPQLRERLAENGRRLVEQKYSWVEIGRKFNDLLRTVVRERGRG